MIYEAYFFQAVLTIDPPHLVINSSYGMNVGRSHKSFHSNRTRTAT